VLRSLPTGAMDLSTVSLWNVQDETAGKRARRVKIWHGETAWLRLTDMKLAPESTLSSRN